MDINIAIEINIAKRNSTLCAYLLLNIIPIIEIINFLILY